MNKKKVISLALSVALVAVIGIGATLAYFTDKADKTNTITMGHVDIDLTEPNFPEGGEIANITPGQVIDKDPTVTLQTGSEDAYIRVKLDVTGLDATQKDQLLAKDEKGAYKYLDINSALWTESNGYFYYVGGNAGILTEGDAVKLFTKVTIPGAEWKNDLVGKSFNIVVSAEAIQADNFTPSTVNGNYGWFEGQTEITAETYTAN